MKPPFWSDPRLLWAIYSLAAVLTAVQRIALGVNELGFSKYENYRIFKYAWIYLIRGENPYAGHPEVWDLYKYSPAFAVGMAPFAALPDWVGLPVWNLLNALPLLAALLVLPRWSLRNRVLAAWLVLPELLISLQNAQSNGLTAALMLWTWIAYERQRPFSAAAWVMAGAFIKVFGIFAALFALFYQKQWIKTALGMAFAALLLALLPWPLLGWDQLMQVYRWWWELLQADHAASTGLSVVGWLKTWWGWEADKTLVLALGLAGQIAAALYASLRGQNPAPVVAATLIWVVIFNHKAESPTFIIAMCGAAIWYFSTPRPSFGMQMTMAATFFLSAMTPTDLFPQDWNRNIVQPYVLKAAPYLFIWGWLLYNIFSKHEQRTDLEIY